MLYYEVLSLVSFWSLLASTTSGAILPSPTTTPPPDLLRARDSDARVCGTNSRHGPVWCSSSSEVCRATILAPGTAWAYCSKPGKIDQVVLTEAVGNWPASKPCPTSSYCCSGRYPEVQTINFVSSSYTVTGFFCGKNQLNFTADPATNFLSPPAFRQSLIQLPGGTAIRSSSATPSSNHHSSHESKDIGVGVGVGVGGAAALFVGIMILLRRRRAARKREEATTESSHDSSAVTAELSGEKTIEELPTKHWDTSELVAKEKPLEMSGQEPQELPTGWEPPQLQRMSEDREDGDDFLSSPEQVHVRKNE